MRISYEPGRSGPIVPRRKGYVLKRPIDDEGFSSAPTQYGQPEPSLSEGAMPAIYSVSPSVRRVAARWRWYQGEAEIDL